MTKKAQHINRFFLIAGILTLLFYLGQGITVRFGQSLLYLWLMLSIVCFARYFLWKRAWKHGKEAPIPKAWLRVIDTVAAAAIAAFLTVEGFVFSGAFQKPPEGLDAIIVLGARVDETGPSGSLRERIAAAEKYLTDNPGTICIASGGQGEDEPMSEAQCIRDYLIAAGIDPERIRLYPLRHARIFHAERVARAGLHLILPLRFRLSVKTTESRFFYAAASHARQSASRSSTACGTHAGRPSVKHSSPTSRSSSQ